jgi:hypothetical protein
MYTEFGSLRNFYPLLISFYSSTFLYAINVPQYHWQMQRTCSEIVHVQTQSCDHN